MNDGDLAARAPGRSWSAVSPSEHFVLFYDEDSLFLDTLEDYVATGLEGSEGVVVIATGAHLRELAHRLTARGIELEAARRRDQYIPVDAEQALSQFMLDHWPDQRLFDALVSGLVTRARGADLRPVRAFGEMVALLWSAGQHAATMRLEQLWRRITQGQSFACFCAYPRDAFDPRSTSSLIQICATHTHVVA